MVGVLVEIGNGKYRHSSLSVNKIMEERPKFGEDAAAEVFVDKYGPEDLLHLSAFTHPQIVRDIKDSRADNGGKAQWKRSGYNVPYLSSWSGHKVRADYETDNFSDLGLLYTGTALDKEVIKKY